MGYFELLGLPKPNASPTSQGITFLPFKRGDLSDPEASRFAKQLRIEIEKLVGFGIKKHLLFEGLSEAITNVCQHAYPVGHSFVVKQWWLSASYDVGTGLLCVMFYDQGAGIPATLPSSHFWEKLKASFHIWNDSQKIKAAMEEGRTSTRLSERGKGLQNLIHFAKSHRYGRLSIYSLRGRYSLITEHTNGTRNNRVELQEHETSIGGTLIEWSVNLLKK